MMFHPAKSQRQHQLQCHPCHLEGHRCMQQQHSHFHIRLQQQHYSHLHLHHTDLRLHLQLCKLHLVVIPQVIPPANTLAARGGRRQGSRVSGVNELPGTARRAQRGWISRTPGVQESARGRGCQGSRSLATSLQDMMQVKAGRNYSKMQLCLPPGLRRQCQITGSVRRPCQGKQRPRQEHNQLVTEHAQHTQLPSAEQQEALQAHFVAAGLHMLPQSFLPSVMHTMRCVLRSRRQRG